MILTVVSSIAVVLALAALLLVRSSWIAAQPDEWLLRVRDGRVVDAGVGIALFRRPGDVVARFSSTVQRVRFTVEATSAEHLPLVIDGFILWSVAPDDAFRAFSKLGIANLERAPATLKSRSHLLTSPQHHAFQALLAAEVRAEAGALPLATLLGERDALLQGLSARLRSLAETLGIVIERTEILKAEPADAGLLHDLAARSEEEVREAAANARLEAAERLRKRNAETAQQQADDDAQVRLARVEADRQVALREEQVTAERNLAAEAAALRLQTARQEREEAELAANLQRTRRTAEADRDAAIARAEAEEKKSPPVREHELARLVAEQTTRALASWKIQEGKWIHVGDASPVSSIASMLLGVRELAQKSPVTPRA